MKFSHLQKVWNWEQSLTQDFSVCVCLWLEIDDSAFLECSSWVLNRHFGHKKMMYSICSKAKITSSKVYDALPWCYKFSLVLLEAFFHSMSCVDTKVSAWRARSFCSCMLADSRQNNNASQEATGSTESADVTYAEINSWGLSAPWIYLYDIMYLWQIWEDLNYTSTG